MRVGIEIAAIRPFDSYLLQAEIFLEIVVWEGGQGKGDICRVILNSKEMGIGFPGHVAQHLEQMPKWLWRNR